jgi:hypothetical protein
MIYLTAISRVVQELTRILPVSQGVDSRWWCGCWKLRQPAQGADGLRERLIGDTT